jgi:hypothetical protein
VGRASRAKQQAQAQRRNRTELIEKIREQVQVLDVLGEQFDAGHRVMGYPLATTIRVLVHDTNQSHALLAQVGELTKMPFINTSAPINPRNLLMAHGGLVIMRIAAGTGSTWVPRVGLPPAPDAQPHDVQFAPWWNTDVMRDSDSTLWSRKRMVLAIANKEGGAHIDPEQPVDVRAIEEENSMGWTYRDPIKDDQPISEGPLLPSMRQIAYELEHSIVRHLAAELDFAPSSRSPYEANAQVPAAT